MFRLLILIAVTHTVLSGCALQKNKIVHKAPLKQSIEQRKLQLQQLKQWKIYGKIAFIEKNKRESASLNWQVDEDKQHQQLNLTSYLGINVLHLSSENNLHIIKVDGEEYRSDNLEQLIYSLTKLTLPTKALGFWLKGLPYQRSDTLIIDQNTQLPISLSSDYNSEQWHITYANYQTVNKHQLATKFSIKKNNLLIKIIISKWKI